ncbi:sRNA-binding carbon storage regulator CsrA [Flavobacterium sp. 7E]|uniref:hypothetical protein n=1 Tax=Flavobacterium sp. 7E TaxID=2735898 RepID=UPI00156F5A86|nr:hypothetical protein [Flavobacterium sp. 7E]NRS87185.1 sRNA-binding carbon storage regulator CsrA [Flavobacterium sp. 7E]
MRNLISVLIILILSNHICSAQNEKINLSSIINSILFSGNCDLKNENEKLYFFTFKNEKNKEIINFDTFNSNGVEIVYKTDKKKVSKKLKRVEFGYDVSITIVSQDKNELAITVDLPKINYDLYKKSIKTKIQIVLADSWWDMHYTQKEGKWILSEMTCNGF